MTGLILAIVSWLVFVTASKYAVDGQFLALFYPLAFAVGAFVVTGKELAQEGVRRGVSMAGRVLSVIIGGMSALFLVLYVFDALASRR